MGNIVLNVCSRGATASALVNALAAGEGLSRKATFTVSYNAQIEGVSYVNHQISNHCPFSLSENTTVEGETQRVRLPFYRSSATSLLSDILPLARPS